MMRFHGHCSVWLLFVVEVQQKTVSRVYSSSKWVYWLYILSGSVVSNNSSTLQLSTLRVEGAFKPSHLKHLFTDKLIHGQAKQLRKMHFGQGNQGLNWNVARVSSTFFGRCSCFYIYCVTIGIQVAKASPVLSPKLLNCCLASCANFSASGLAASDAETWRSWMSRLHQQTKGRKMGNTAMIIKLFWQYIEVVRVLQQSYH